MKEIIKKVKELGKTSRSNVVDFISPENLKDLISEFNEKRSNTPEDLVDEAKEVAFKLNSIGGIMKSVYSDIPKAISPLKQGESWSKMEMIINEVTGLGLLRVGQLASKVYNADKIRDLINRYNKEAKWIGADLTSHSHRAGYFLHMVKNYIHAEKGIEFPEVIIPDPKKNSELDVFLYYIEELQKKLIENSGKDYDSEFHELIDRLNEVSTEKRYTDDEIEKIRKKLIDANKIYLALSGKDFSSEIK